MSDPYGTPASVPYGDEARPGEGRARRLARSASELIQRPREGIDTLWDVLSYCAETYGSERAMGSRAVVKIIEEEKDVTKIVGGQPVTEKKTWKFFQLADPKYISYIELLAAVTEVGKGLINLGIRKEDVFNVYASTSLEWQLVAHGCAAVSTPVATAYDSLGEEGLSHSLNEPECAGIFTNADLLPMLLKVLPNVPTLRVIVYDGTPEGDVLDRIHAVRDGLRVLTLHDLRALATHVSDDEFRARRPAREDVALIMYTSGSTGPPKGVVITHANLSATLASVHMIVFERNIFHGRDTFLAYLPLAHILEFVVELANVYNGIPIGYGRVKTLLDSSVRNCRGDLAVYKPTNLVGVPAVWEMIRKGIEAKVASGGAVKSAIFYAAMTLKRWQVPVLAGVAEAILSKVKEATGGRLVLALSGGSAMSIETQDFLSTALAPVLQGYGLTESCGMCAILPLEKFQYGPAGVPAPAVEIKLIDVEEAGYHANADPPQGEILLRGPAVIKGYYKRPDLNSDESVFTKDGWFRTGDVGQWNPDGTLSIIDRIKNLIKLQSGEYIALERLEAVYKSCPLVQTLCVSADAHASRPLAVVCPLEINLRRALAANPSVNAQTSFAELCELPEARDLVLKETQTVGKRAGLRSMELLEAVVLTADEWTPESGLVTAAQKIQRKKIATKYEAEIKAVLKRH